MGIWLLEFTKMLTRKATLRGTVVYLRGWGGEESMSRLPHTRAPHVEVRENFLVPSLLLVFEAGSLLFLLLSSIL